MKEVLNSSTFPIAHYSITLLLSNADLKLFLRCWNAYFRIKPGVV